MKAFVRSAELDRPHHPCNKKLWQRDDLLVIENVPVISCPACGESYLTVETLRDIDNIKRNRTKIATERPVPVAVFV